MMDHILKHEYQQELHFFKSSIFHGDCEKGCLENLKNLLGKYSSLFDITPYLIYDQSKPSNVYQYNLISTATHSQWVEVLNYLFDKKLLNNLPNYKSLFSNGFFNHKGAKYRKFHGKNNKVFQFFMTNFRDKIEFDENFANSIIFQRNGIDPSDYCLFDSFNLDYTQKIQGFDKNLLEFSIIDKDLFAFKKLLKYYKVDNFENEIDFAKKEIIFSKPTLNKFVELMTNAKLKQ